ncbi:MAG: FAD-linked oxidase C-terminal domain-containing protein [Bacteroidales bacterium]
MNEQILFKELKDKLKGEFHTSQIYKTIYSTDASSYREMPVAVAYPKDINDLRTLIAFANKNEIPLIPRTAGTSLAGQVVGKGIVVDVSKYFRQILELNKENKWVRIEPGVVLDELNMFLEPHGLFFGPETSTSNRCMLGGMVGNNSCGSHSLIYGSTRDHTLEVKGLLSDGSEVLFKEMNLNEFEEKCQLPGLEGNIYRNINQMLSDKKNADEIRKEFPDKSIRRRNTGYAIDLLLETEPFAKNVEPFNFSKLIAGSEGTLVLATEIKLNLVDLPPKENGVIAAHFNTLEEAFEANLVGLKYNPGAIELIDKNIIELTKDNLSQQANRFFIEGSPAAILVIEFARATRDEIDEIAKNLEAELRSRGLGYHFPLIFGNDIKKIWGLRKAGLGVLTNLPGDAKPIGFIEDTAVKPEQLPAYMSEFKAILTKYNLDCVYYAHIGSGEIHLRPVLNLKKAADVNLYYKVALETAKLVKKYNGSLSGEHGDGRLRGEFIPLMLGEHNYNLFKELKKCWDPKNIFNPNKIVDTPPMAGSLRFKPDHETPEIETIFDFSKSIGFVRAAENCNGSGDCRKSHIIGGAMCPSYQATFDEKNTTRARANMLRETMNSGIKNPFGSAEVKDILDLCLSCKACKSECPSSVDMTKLKAEFLQHYYDLKGVPLRSKLIANISRINQLAMPVGFIYNFFVKTPFFSKPLNSIMGFSPNRKFPALSKKTLRKYVKEYYEKLQLNIKDNKKGKVYLFADEFTNFNDAEIGIKAVHLLNNLGYEVLVPKHLESGRTYLSKGLVKKAKKLAQKNIELLKDMISSDTPLIGIEPSAILTFRDEYRELFKKDTEKAEFEQAEKLSKNCLMIEEFISREMEKGNINSDSFSKEEKMLKLHGHCYQKALTTTNPVKKALSLPENYKLEEIPSGCCGMAGSFGYEKEHYELSMKVGELVLFPAVRNALEGTIIVASGTSCRHQIKDGTGVKAQHPVEILYDALIK